MGWHRRDVKGTLSGERETVTVKGKQMSKKKKLLSTIPQKTHTRRPYLSKSASALPP